MSYGPTGLKGFRCPKPAADMPTMRVHAEQFRVTRHKEEFEGKEVPFTGVGS